MQKAYNFLNIPGVNLSLKDRGGFNINFYKNFEDGGIVDDLEGDPSDYGMTQTDFDFATNVGQKTGGFGDDNTEQQIANYLGQAQVGMSPRSNIKESSRYDPSFAAALDIRRGLDPTFNFQGTGIVTVPQNLRPQIQGEFDSEADMVRPMFYSGAEKFLVQDAPKLVERGMDMGIMGIFSKLFGQVGNLLSPQQVKRSDTQ